MISILQGTVGQGCGCDQPPHQSALIGIDTALERLAHHVQALSETEEVPLARAGGRVLAEAVHALTPVPPFDNSAMDGFAIDTNALRGNGPLHLKVTDRIPAGQVGSTAGSGLSASQIFTGAPIPRGANAVVMQEHVRRLNDVIILDAKVAAGAHIRKAGEDMALGAEVVSKGRRLTPGSIAACAAAGHRSVQVTRRIRVALLVTGDEVRGAEHSQQSARIMDVNSPMLAAALTHPLIHLSAVQTIGDSPAALQATLAKLAETSDLIVTTGGISVGEEDHVKPALAALGAEVVFSGVAIKPGKPVSLGKLGCSHWLGLPGNPLSAFLTWQLFGTALCRHLSGDSGPGPRRRHVVLDHPLHHKPGRCELRLAQLVGFDATGREVVSFEDATHSARVSRLPDMDGVLLIPSDVDHLPKGALVEFQQFCDG